MAINAFLFLNIEKEGIFIMENKKSARGFMKQKKGTGTVTFVIGIVVLIIVISSVALPMINEATANLSGTEATILGVSGTLLAVLVIVYIANAM